jgi:hypothetical protein
MTTRPAEAQIPGRRRERRVQRALARIDVDRNALPVRCDRHTGAAIVSKLFFPVSERTLERWPIGTVTVNGKAIMLTADLLAHAEAKIAGAAKIRGGRAAVAEGRTASN